MKQTVFFKSLVVILIACGSPASAAPLGTGFTYQGQLKNAGQPANGTFNLVFTLWDAAGAGNPPTGGNQIGNPDFESSTQVANGLFTVQLNDTNQFGAAAFAGQGRWLQISVNGTTLGPRQPLAAAPYALFALDGPGAPGFWAANGTSIYKTNTGGVGIGTTTPAGLLHMSSLGGVDLIIDADTNNGGGEDQNARIVLKQDGGVVAGRIGYRNGLNSLEIMQEYGDSLILGAGNLDAVTIAPSGNMGVNESAPTANLHLNRSSGDTDAALKVTTTAGIPGFTVTRDTTIDHGAINCLDSSGAGAPLRLNSTSTGAVLLAEGGGSVGIGTADPQTTFQIVLPGGGEVRTTTPGGVPGHIYFAENGNRRDIRAYDDSLRILASASSSAPSSTDGIVIADDGNVGIGTSSPTARLQAVATNATAYAGYFDGFGTLFGGNGLLVTGATHLLGTVGVGTTAVPAGVLLNIDGTTRTKVLEITGADVAEKFPASDKPEPGMVMEIDPDNAGKLRIARGAYNRRVAGIVSGATSLDRESFLGPGAVLGNLPGNEDSPAVALSGRVYCICDATNDAIEPGDLLTTSSTPGHAMKATDYARGQGAILGKAMTALKGGERGLVLVLVSLQ